MAAAARPTRLTGRAALLAVVICAIALSLAYPVREYIAQRQQIDQLLALQQANAAQVQALEQENGRLTQTWYSRGTGGRSRTTARASCPTSSKRRPGCLTARRSRRSTT